MGLVLLEADHLGIYIFPFHSLVLQRVKRKREEGWEEGMKKEKDHTTWRNYLEKLSRLGKFGGLQREFRWPCFSRTWEENLRCKVQLGPGGQTQDELTRSLPEGQGQETLECFKSAPHWLYNYTGIHLGYLNFRSPDTSGNSDVERRWSIRDSTERPRYTELFFPF